MSLSKTIERSHPYVLAIVSAPGWFFLLRWLHLQNQEAKDLFSTILNVSAIAAGFLGTTASILLTMAPTAVIKDLRDSGALRLLYRYVVCAVQHQFGLVLFSVGLMVLYPKIEHPQILFWIVLVWGVFATLAALSSFRVIQLFAKVITADSGAAGKIPK